MNNNHRNQLPIRFACAALAGLLAALCGCTATADLGKTPTVESDPITASGETAVTAALSADEARNVPYTVSSISTEAPAATDLSFAQIAIRVQDIYTTADGPSDDGKWMLQYIPAGANSAANDGRSLYVCNRMPAAEESKSSPTAFAVLDGITGSVLRYSVYCPDSEEDPGRMLVNALSEDQKATLQSKGHLTDEEYAALDALYAERRNALTEWASSSAPAAYRDKITAVLGVDADSWKPESSGIWPETAKAYLDENYAVMRQIKLQADSTVSVGTLTYGVPLYRGTRDGQPCTLMLYDDVGSCYLRYFAVESFETDVNSGAIDQVVQEDGSIVLENPALTGEEPTPEQPAEGWYEQAKDGSWYHVGPDGKPG